MPSGTIPGTNGQWDWDVTTGPSFPQFGTLKGNDKIKITYKPNRNPNGCKDIRLIQVVKWEGYNAAGQLVTTDPDEFYPPGTKHKFRHRAGSQVTDSGKIYCVDYLKCNSEPYYNGASTKGPSRGNATAPAPPAPPKPTTMSDNVNTGLMAMKPAIVKVVKHFEVCAICVDTGAVLDCMSWTSTATRVPKHSGDITVNPTGSGTSSGAFDKALKQFVKTHTVTANGKKSWKCEQSGKKGKNSKTGKLLPPIKNAFYQMWSPPDQTGMQWEDSDDSGEMVAQNTFRVHHIAPEAIGGGRFSPDLIEVLELMAANPGQAALKFTWLGEQDRTVAGVLFAGNPEVSTADIASYVVPDYRYGNDTTALVSVGITDYLLLNILDGLSSLVGTLAKGKGSVGVAAIANIDDCKGPAYLGEIPAEYVDFLLKGASIPEEEQQETIDALGYLILNMGA